MDNGKRQTKLTVKAKANKIERLQKEDKSNVNKIKGLTPIVKQLMKRKENAPQMHSLCETTDKLQDALIPLLPDEEQKKKRNGLQAL